jgi:alpha-glucosidase
VDILFLTMNPRRASIAIILATLILGKAHAESITLSADKANVHITAISPSIFRISVNANGNAAPLQSIFLDPALKPDDVGRITENNGHRRLTTDLATVDIDPVAGTFSLLDSHGTILTPPTSIANLTTRGDKQSLELHVGWSNDHPFKIYGCGNGANSLLQSSIHARVGNGVAVQPFFWAPAGFATFVVGSDDNSPAQCDGHIVNGAVTWRVPGAAADVYLIVAPTLSQASQSLLKLTGLPPVPPKWAFGYLQSRWGWVDKNYWQDALKQFTNRKLPVDAFIFDFEWYTTFPDYDVKPQGVKDFSDFQWNPKLFPNPTEDIKELHDAGVHFVGIRKPRLGNSQTLVDVRGKGWGFHSSSSSNIDARGLWFASADARNWYAAQMEPLLRVGIDGWWDDEGEFTYSNYNYWNQAERQALDAVRPDARLWTINRAFEPGTSRYGAAAWTGDIRSTWDDLRKTPTALLNWSLAGMPFAGCDIGGFAGQVTPELLVRWMQAGTFFPVMRAHSDLKVKPHFPWLFGDDAENAIRKTLELRYRLIPILYSLAHETHDKGQPMMRPLIMQYPTDPDAADLSSEWLVGTNLLAAPMLEQHGHRKIYLPDDIWYDFATGERIPGGHEIEKDVPFDTVPLYIRGGAILTLAPFVQHTRDLPGGPLDVHIYPGRDGNFTLVEDDGSTNAYLAGNVRKTTFTWDDANRILSWARVDPYDGEDCFRSLRITLHDGKIHTPIEETLSATGKISVPR